MRINNLISELHIEKIEAEALLILEEVDEDGFEKAASKFPHPSAANAWAKRDGLNPKKVMKIWELILQISGKMDIAYNMPQFINTYKSIDTVNAAQVKKRVASDNKTNTHTKQSIDDVIVKLEKTLKGKKNPAFASEVKDEKKAAKSDKKTKLSVKKLTAEINRLKAQNPTPTREAKIKKLWAERTQLNASLK